MALHLRSASGYTARAPRSEVEKLFVRTSKLMHLAPDRCTTDYDIMLQLGDEATQLHAQGRDDLALQVLSEALGLVRAEPLKGVKGSPWITALRAEIRDRVGVHGCGRRGVGAGGANGPPSLLSASSSPPRCTAWAQRPAPGRQAEAPNDATLERVRDLLRSVSI